MRLLTQTRSKQLTVKIIEVEGLRSNGDNLSVTLQVAFRRGQDEWRAHYNPVVRLSVRHDKLEYGLLADMLSDERLAALYFYCEEIGPLRRE